MAAADRPAAGALVLVGGHESDGGRELPPLPPGEPLPAVPLHVAASGRSLEHALAAAAAEAGPAAPVVVVPMTLGRDPRLVSDAARTLRWAARGDGAGRFALAAPFGTSVHLVSWLRAACLRLRDDEAAVLLAAAAADPFDDAELHRVAALVRAYSGRRLVEVGLIARGGGLDEGRERCLRLGAERVAIVPAAFGTPPGAAAPLLSPAATARVVAERAARARHRLVEHGDDGVAAAHAADHLHGFAHSHEGDDAGGHTHAHGHAHAAVR